jgi:site-specific DNA-cytosine methylase
MTGYVVEWRAVNAADYGMPQRRRSFTLAIWNTSDIYKKIERNHTDWPMWVP